MFGQLCEIGYSSLGINSRLGERQLSASQNICVKISGVIQLVKYLKTRNVEESMKLVRPKL